LIWSLHCLLYAPRPTMASMRNPLVIALAAGAGYSATQLFVAPSSSRNLAENENSRLRGAMSSEPMAAAEFGAPAVATSSAALTLAGFAGVVAVSGRSRRSAAKAEAKAAPAVFEPSQQIGAVAPLGYFDPLGFCSSGDKDGFDIGRAAEIKHGRVAMMASIGLLVQHYVKVPGIERSGIGALSDIGAQWLAFGLFAWCGVMEIIVWDQKFDKEPGNFGDPLGLNMYNPEMRNKEINNGRFAMICVIGILAAEAASGKDAIQQFGL
jgi:light-harvesting complex I chlorophyll a/b binding protein 1